jgi:flagellin
MLATAIVSNLLQPINDTIVVTSSGSAGVPLTLTTAAGSVANFQIGANAGDTLGVSFADTTTAAAGYGTFSASITAFDTAVSSGTGIIAAAQALITSSDTAIGYISNVRGNFGATENRLQHTVASISVASENLNASTSRIKDLDVAAEMVHFTKTQIMQQAGMAILAQANSAPQNVLALLR